MNMNKEDRALYAAELLANPIYLETLDTLRAQAVREWEASDNPLDRECCHARFRAVSGLHRAIVNEIERAANEELRAGNREGRFRALYNSIKEQFK
jgi:hypothetical protein